MKFFSFSSACLIPLLLCSCGESPSSSNAPSLKTGSYPDWSLSEKSDDEKWRKDLSPILHGIVRRQFENLDPFLEKLDERCRSGRALRSVFYDAFENYHFRANDAARYHPEYEKGFLEWAKLKPESPAQTIGLAALYLDRGWMSRGTGWAKDVTKEGMKGFQENLEKSHRLLREAPDFVKMDPHYYKLLISIGIGKGLPLEEVNGYFEAGQKIDPLYLQLYFTVTECLQPYWYGENSTQWHDWLDNALKYEGVGEEDREVIYGSVVRSKIRHDYKDYGSNAFEVMGVDKQRFMRGLSAYVRRYPESSSWPLHYFYHANMAYDVEAMKDAIELSGRLYDPFVWKPASSLWAVFDQVSDKYPEMAEVLGREL
ncbi:MAG: hypothetical protein P1U89_03045 [Verrucomicrobiales bacterium]|nr:hypothetical protein [Verrucomicrobiales bacterium]